VLSCEPIATPLHPPTHVSLLLNKGNLSPPYSNTSNFGTSPEILATLDQSYRSTAGSLRPHWRHWARLLEQGNSPSSDEDEDDDSHVDREKCEMVTLSMMLEFLNCVADYLYQPTPEELKDDKMAGPAFALTFESVLQRSRGLGDLSLIVTERGRITHRAPFPRVRISFYGKPSSTYPSISSSGGHKPMNRNWTSKW
jgi:hypothetical protein